MPTTARQRPRHSGHRLAQLIRVQPMVRHTDAWLTTRDAMPFYETLGFAIAQQFPDRHFPEPTG